MTTRHLPACCMLEVKLEVRTGLRRAPQRGRLALRRRAPPRVEAGSAALLLLLLLLGAEAPAAQRHACCRRHARHSTRPVGQRPRPQSHGTAHAQLARRVSGWRPRGRLWLR